jgi:hypothetical protein
MKATNLIGLCQKSVPGASDALPLFPYDCPSGGVSFESHGECPARNACPHFLRRWAKLTRQMEKALFSEHFVSLRLRPEAGTTPRKGTYRDQVSSFIFLRPTSLDAELHAERV